LAPPENRFLGVPGAFNGDRPFSEATARTIDEEVLKILDESHAHARRLLGEHRRALDALVKALLEHETLDEKTILWVTALPPAPPLETKKLPVEEAARDRRAVSAH
jgi:cell division protease FtsH